jgi:8-oxo-dGTP pyrophosphatase MutT (NUDIX family)
LKTNCTDGKFKDDDIREYLKHPIVFSSSLLSPPGLKPAAVLIPLFCWKGEWNILFTRRTNSVNNHKGQVSFPGGAVEITDTDLEITACREAEEEIGLHPKDINILGKLGEQPTISSYLITPYVARIPWPYSFRLSSDEVSRVFWIPLVWLAEPSNREEKPYQLSNGKVEKVVFFHPYDGEVVWGITGRITVTLLTTLRLIN